MIIDYQFKIMADSVPVLLWVSDVAGIRYFFNAGWLDFTGCTIGKAADDGWKVCIDPEDLPQYLASWSTAFHQKQTSLSTYRLKRPDGSYSWISEKAVPRYAADGHFAGYIGSCTDIDKLVRSEIALAEINNELAEANKELSETQAELKESMAELEESEARFKFLIQEAPIAIGVLQGSELIIESANDMTLKLWGKSKGVIGQSLKQALPELDGQPYMELLGEVYDSGRALACSEIRALMEHRGEMREFFVDFIFKPMLDKSGKTTDILVIATDVTDKVRSIKEAGFAEESLRMAIDSAELGYFYMHVIDRSVFVQNARLREFFGYGPDEDFSYLQAINQVHPDYRQAVYEMSEASIAKGIRFDMEYPIVGHHDGKIRWVRGLGMVRRDKNGVNSYFTGVLNEITEKKQDEIRKNDFINMVSHELKTPLSSLSAIIQVLAVRLKNNHDSFVADTFDKAKAQVKKMLNIINGFLDISKLESGKIRLEKRNFNITELIVEQIRETELTISSHHIQFEYDEPLLLNADYEMIGSVISNLIRNAVKYSPEGKRIEIQCAQTGDEVLVSIKDEGIGISPQDKEMLFERYYRGNNKLTQHVTGFGIGLYLCAEIIRRHEGRIWVENGPDTGSVFCFALPGKQEATVIKMLL